MSGEPRLPAHLEVGALIRRIGAEGGFGSVLHKGEGDAGTILLVLTERGADPRLYERMPQPGGSREWTRIIPKSGINHLETEDYLARRTLQDPDLWIVELDIANPERFIGLSRSTD